MVDKQKQGKMMEPRGMWSPAKVTYSRETQDLLKEMMRESKLTNFQQRHLDKVVKGGSSLPKTVNPTSSARPKPPPKVKQPSKVVDPRTDLQIRTKEQIESSGAYERDQYAPSPLCKYGGFYEKDKKRLANIMAYGEDLPPPETKKSPEKLKPEQDVAPVDRFEELQHEINERKDFLQEMDSLGRSGKYRSIIETEISQKIREMEVIDKTRTEQLDRLLAAEDRKKLQDEQL